MAVGTRDDQTAPPTTADKAGVFISYAREDQHIVERLAAALRANGRDVWIDTDAIRGSDEWADAIDAGIESSDAVAFLLSPAFVESEQCDRELQHALVNGKRLVPLLGRAVDPAVVQPELARLNWIEIEGDGTGVAALEEALDTDLEWVRAHTDLLVRAVAWDARGEDRGLLLRGRPLADAEQFLANASGKDPPPAQLQIRYVLAARQAATRRQRGTIAVVTTFLGVAIALSVLAILQRNRAVHESNVAKSRELAGSSTAVVNSDPELARVLAVAAMDRAQTPEAVAALRQAVSQPAALRVRGDVLDLSPDGRFVAVHRSDGTVAIRNVASGRLVASHRISDPRSVAFARGHRLLAYTTAADDVFLWDFGHRVLKRVSGTGAAVAFGPDDSKLLIAKFRPGPVEVIDVRSGDRVTPAAEAGEPEPFPGAVTAAFAPRGDLVVTWNEHSGEARIWHARTGALQSRLPHGANITAADISADGKLALTAGRDMTVRFWDPMTGAGRGHAINVPPADDDAFDVDIAAASFSPQGSAFLMTLTQDHVQVWRTRDAKLQLNLPNRFSRASFGPAAPYLLTRTGIRDWVHNRSVAEPRMGVTLLQRNGSFESVDDLGDVSRVWSGKTESTLIELSRRAADVSSAGGRVAVGYTDGTAEVRDAGSGRVVLRVPRIRSERVAVELSPDGRLLAVARRAGVELWRVGSNEPRRLESSVNAAVGFSADGSRVLVFTGNGAGDYEVLDTKTGKRIGKTFGIRTVQIDSAALSPDGRLLAQPTADKTVAVFRVADGSRVGRPLRGFSNTVADLAFSPDGKLVASGGYDGRAIVWDLDTARRVAILTSHRAEVTRVAFSPDGRWLVTRSADGTLRVWEAGTGAPVETWTDLPKGLPTASEIDVPAIPDLGLDFSASSDALLRADDDYVYRIPCPACADPDELLTRAKSETHRSLTPVERRQYLHQG